MLYFSVRGELNMVLRKINGFVKKNAFGKRSVSVILSTALLITSVNIQAFADELNSGKSFFYAGKCYDSLYDAIDESFDVIISNPPIRAGKQIVHGVIKEGFSHLNKGGMVYVVIQKKQGAESLKKVMEETFGNVSLVNKNNGYMIYKSVKEM